MDKIVIGNLKMSMTKNDVSDYLKDMKNLTNKNVVICPTSIYIPYFLNQPYKACLQNIYFGDEGHYTGEISPRQAISMGISYALVGHSERRKYLKETDEDINKKILEAAKYGMTSIVCIGEMLKEKKINKIKKILKQQILEDFKNVPLDRVIIAYEPVWAIGTDELPTNKVIEELVDFIKNEIKKIYQFENTRVIYGGSINKENVKIIKNIENIDGILVGESATRSEEFLEIIDTYLK